MVMLLIGVLGHCEEGTSEEELTLVAVELE